MPYDIESGLEVKNRVDFANVESTVDIGLQAGKSVFSGVTGEETKLIKKQGHIGSEAIDSDHEDPFKNFGDTVQLGDGSPVGED